ncbi:MAG TPA: DNA polymerase III subunit gamma/tau [Candidatus Marinimicrobia bacterium]|nr:DNA polymerase III subunit gamma/tau [Candidatus Neomarinimicrobiota bacterium]HRS51284.1 DNA polymerase III subunit gamma/tau [Candidatus Neomarinimicrobiota bacterium]HRU91478.1 DNA polymerase III subunit gamma/tau [Candidatus Neomarinimicrobiota bacterium]
MNYQVVSRKYRPQNFNEIIGQEHICTTLQNALKSGRIAHAYLFTGSRGIGKTSTARILAKTLNCLNPQEFNPCNVCQNCIEITSSRSMDVIEIDGASNRGIDQVRELRENVKYPPSNSKYRIFIIDEVHMLTREAFNALLKTLEEPPPQVVFIFATTEPLKVPLTIISRCQRYDFHRIPVREIVGQLKKIAQSENLAVSDEILTLLAKKSEGAMRDAESLLEQVISFSSENINLNSIQKLLGLTDYEYYFSISNQIFEHDLNALIKSAEEIFNNGVNISEFLIGLSEHFRNLLITAIVKSAADLDLPDSFKNHYQEEAQRWSTNDLMRLLKLIGEAQVGLRTSMNQRTHLEFALLRMGAMEKTVTIQSILQDIDNRHLGSTVQPKPAARTIDIFTPKPVISQSFSNTQNNTVKEKEAEKYKPEKESEPPPKPSGGLVTLEAIQAQWATIILKLGKNNRSLAEFLNVAMPMQLNGNVLDLGFTSERDFARKNIAKRAQIIEQTLTEFFNKAIKIRCIQIESADKSADTVKKPIDEMTEKIVDMFDGEIIIT